MSEQVINDDARKAFHESRATGIGATDSPAILGLSKWGTPLTVYHDKVDPPDERAQSLPAWLGNRLQDVVAELYTAQTGIRLRADNKHHRHPRLPWLVCHLDYRAWGQPKLLVECKTRAYMTGWGEEGTKEIPPDIWVQCQHEMAVTGATRCDVAVLFGHHTFRVYEIDRDEAFITSLLSRLEQFWHYNVEARVPPEPTASEHDDALIRKMHPDHDDTMLPATPEQDALARGYRLAQQNMKQVKETADGIKHRLQEIIGDHAGIRGAFGQITWKKSAPSTVTDWAAVAAAYRGAIEGLTPDAIPACPHIGDWLLDHDLDAIESLYTRTEPGSRRFLTTFTKEDE